VTPDLVLRGKTFPPFQITANREVCVCVCVCGDSVVGVRCVRKWCRQFDSGWMGLHDDFTVWPITSRMDLNTAWVQHWLWAAAAVLGRLLIPQGWGNGNGYLWMFMVTIGWFLLQSKL